MLLADDHALVLEAFAKLLAADYDIVGVAADGRALVDAVDRLKPDVVVLDVEMPHLSGVEAARRIKLRDRRVKLVFLSVTEDADVAAEAFRAGASAYVVKRASALELALAIREAMEGHLYVTPLVAEGSAESTMTQRPWTPREREILRRLAMGCSVIEIADALDLAPRTVASYKYRLMERLHVTSTAALIRYAIRAHIV